MSFVSLFQLIGSLFFPVYRINNSPGGAWGLNVNAEGWRDLHRKVLHATCQPPHTSTPLYAPQPIVSLFFFISFSKCGSQWLKCKLQYTAGRKRNLVVMVAGGGGGGWGWGGVGAGSPTIKPGSCPPALFTAVVPAQFLCFLPTFSASCPFRAINLIRHTWIPTMLLMSFVPSKTNRGRKEVVL